MQEVSAGRLEGSDVKTPDDLLTHSLAYSRVHALLDDRMESVRGRIAKHSLPLYQKLHLPFLLLCCSQKGTRLSRLRTLTGT